MEGESRIDLESGLGSSEFWEELSTLNVERTIEAKEISATGIISRIGANPRAGIKFSITQEEKFSKTGIILVLWFVKLNWPLRRGLQ